LSRSQSKKAGSVDIWLGDLAGWLAKRLRLNEYKKIQLEADLQTAGMNITPERHLAGALVKSGLAGVLVIPALLIFPPISILFGVLAVMLYNSEKNGVRKRIKAKRDAINFELPRLVFAIEKTLEHSRDVLGILEEYKKTAGPEFGHELNITVADMRSGNYESALTRLEARVGSPMLSDVARGLIGVIRGDDTGLYWAALSVKFADIGRQMLKEQAQKVPGKVKKLSMILLFCFMLTYIIIIVMQVVTSLGAMFGGM